MYDLIVVRKLNKKKVAGLIIILILLIVLSIITGIKIADYNEKKVYSQELQNQEIQLREEEERKQKEEEEKQKQILQEHIALTSVPLTDEQKDNILHIYRSTGEKRVFLTFDDGPTKTVTPLILDVLKQEDVKATFFVLGNNVKNNPDLVKRAFEEGHYIANHGYSHKYSEVYATPEATLNEYNVTE